MELVSIHMWRVLLFHMTWLIFIQNAKILIENCIIYEEDVPVFDLPDAAGDCALCSLESIVNIVCCDEIQCVPIYWIMYNLIIPADRSALKLDVHLSYQEVLDNKCQQNGTLLSQLIIATNILAFHIA